MMQELLIVQNVHNVHTPQKETSDCLLKCKQSVDYCARITRFTHYIEYNETPKRNFVETVCRIDVQAPSLEVSTKGI